MNAGLAYLLRRSPARLSRSLRKHARGVKGGLKVVAVLVFLALVLVPQIWVAARDGGDPAELARRARLYGPFCMLSFIVLSLVTGSTGKAGLYFKPPEVDFLFPAPVSRRQLLVYQVLSRFLLQALSALWVTIFVLRWAPTWYGCLLGVFFSLACLQVIAQALQLGSAALGQRLARPARWVLLGTIVSLLAWGAAAAIERLDLGAGGGAAFETLAASPGARLATAPFRPFINTFAAQTPLDVLAWGSLSASLIASVVWLMTRLDVAYEEGALEFSRKVHAKLQRMRAGGGAFAAIRPGKRRFGLPRFPRARGAGPIAWRQCLSIVRNLRAVLLAGGMILIWPLLIVGFIGVKSGGDEEAGRWVALSALPVVLTFAVVWTQNLPFDFRREMDRMGYLRSLPLSPLAVAAGQVTAAAVLLAVILTIALGAIVTMGGFLPFHFAPLLFPALLPVTWAVIAVDNGLFLIFPHRVDPEDAGNVGFMGKMMLVMFLKFAVLGVVFVGAGLAGTIVGLLLTSVPAGAAAGIVSLAFADIGLTYLVGRAFAAFDPAGDVPE